MKPIKQTVYVPIKVENASGNYIPDSSALIVKEQGELDKFWETLVKRQEGYFLTPEQLNEYTENVIKQALENAADEARIKFIPFTDNEEVDQQSILNTFEQTFNKFKI